MPRVRRLGTYGPQNGRSGRRALGCRRPLRDKGRRLLFLRDERLLTALLRLLIEPDGRGLTVTGESQLHRTFPVPKRAFSRLAN